MRIVISFYILFFSLIAVSQSGGYTFHDNFNDNSKNWLEANEQGIISSISDGKYQIQHTNESGAALFWNYNVNINPEEDFDISAIVKQIEGREDYGYGLTWGGKDGSNFFSFTISSNGSINIYKFDHGQLIDILPMQEHGGLVKQLGFNNKLKISKRENNISFFVNGAYIYSYAFEDFFGSTFGFVLNSNMTVIADDFLVTDQIVNESKKKPEVVWFSPDKAVSISNENSISIEAGIKSELSLNKISVFINNRQIGDITSFHKLRNTAQQEFDEIISEEAMLINGINEIKIVMEDYQGNITESKRTVKVQHTQHQHLRHDYALLFATDNYEYWGDLTNPIHDAETIAAELSEFYGFTVEVVKNATNAEMMAKLKEYANKTFNSKDQLFVFFAGHGKFDRDFGEGYVVCSNSLTENLDAGNTSFLAHSTLRTVVDHIPCNHIFLMMDVCFGGTFDPRLGHAMHRGVGGDGIYGNLSKEQYIYTTLRYKTRKYLTSGGAKYVQDGTPGQHSPFVRKVLESLRSRGGEDGILTLAELTHNVEKLKTTPHFGEFGSNEPGSEFLFIVD